MAGVDTSSLYGRTRSLSILLCSKGQQLQFCINQMKQVNSSYSGSGSTVMTLLCDKHYPDYHYHHHHHHHASTFAGTLSSLFV